MYVKPDSLDKTQAKNTYLLFFGTRIFELVCLNVSVFECVRKRIFELVFSNTSFRVCVFERSCFRMCSKANARNRVFER